MIYKTQKYTKTQYKMEEDYYDYDDDYTQYLDFLTEEEQEEEQFFFDLDFDPKFNPGFYESSESSESSEYILFENIFFTNNINVVYNSTKY